MKHIPRVYTEKKLEQDAVLSVPDSCVHHLLNVMKIATGSNIKLFNLTCGEWLCECDVSKKSISARCLEKLKDYQAPLVKFRLAFSLINPNRINFIFEKCAEIGVDEFIPVITEYSQYSSINLERAKKILISSAEQCGRLDIPQINSPVKLLDLLRGSTNLVVADMTGVSLVNAVADFKKSRQKEITVLVGPEGGFSENELTYIKEQNSASIVKFAGHIMRAETACVSCISQLQALLENV